MRIRNIAGLRPNQTKPLMKSIPNQLFILFRLKKISDTQAIICWRITINKKRSEVQTEFIINIKDWDGPTQRLTPTTKEAQRINHHLLVIKSRLQGHYNNLVAHGADITAEALKNAYLGIQPAQKSLAALMVFYTSLFEEQVLAGNKSKHTLKCIKTTIAKVNAFLKHQYKISDIALNDIKRPFAGEFYHYLTTTEKGCNNTALKYIRTLRRFLKLAVDREWLTINHLANYKCKYVQPNRDYLTMSEVMRLYKKNLHIPRLSEVRDVFLFACFTGFAYQDVYGLTPANLEIGIDGNLWIVTKRGKTNVPENVPLLPIALEIVERYKTHPWCIHNNRLLPVNSNQSFNAFLKEVAILCGIKKNLTTHLARHTFATTITLDNDVPIETVSQLLGHKSIKTTQIYAKISQMKLAKNMQALKERLTQAQEGKNKPGN
jgi:site-specific recombinase XerD